MLPLDNSESIFTLLFYFFFLTFNSFLKSYKRIDTGIINICIQLDYFAFSWEWLKAKMSTHMYDDGRILKIWRLQLMGEYIQFVFKY